MRAPPSVPHPVSGPTYPPSMRFGGALLIVLVAIGALRMADTLQAHPPSFTGWTMIVGAAVAFVGSYWMVLRSVTTIDADGIRQSGFIDRTMAWRDVAKARVLRLPVSGTRLVLSSALGRMRAFPAGNAALAAEYARIALHYGGRP